MRLLQNILLYFLVTVSASEIDLLKKAFFDYTMDNEIQRSSVEIQGYLDSMQLDGTFPDLIYNRTSSNSFKHSQRLRRMAVAYYDSTRVHYQDSTTLDKILLGINYWVQPREEADGSIKPGFQTDNWFYRAITFPREFYEVAVILDYQRDLPDSLKSYSKDYLLYSWQEGQLPNWTGANLMDAMPGTLGGALLAEDSLLLQQIMAKIEEALRPEFSDTLGLRDVLGTDDRVNHDGIQIDYSYSMHSNIVRLLQTGSYGLSFMTKFSPVIVPLRKPTAFQMSDSAFRMIEGMLLDHAQWISWGSVMDYAALGRSNSGSGAYDNAFKFRAPVKRIGSISPNRGSEYTDWLNRIENNLGGGPVGNRHFWRNEFTVQRTEDWYFSLKMSSFRTGGNQSLYEEGFRNFHTGHGVYYIMQTGDEYRDIFPVWDWHKLPGLTANLHGDDFEDFPEVTGSWQNNYGGTFFSGAASDSTMALSAMMFDRDSMSYNKSWFTTPEGVLAMGSAITCEGDSTVFTTLEQSNLTGPVTQIGENRVIHNNVLYENLDLTHELSLSTKMRTGSYYLIDTIASKDPITLPLFTLGIDHGEKPIDDAYTYGIVPNPSDSLSSVGSQFPIEALVRTPSIHAAKLRSTGEIGVTFFEAGTLEGQGLPILSSDAPVILMMDTTGGDLTLHYSDPLFQQSNAKIKLAGHYQGMDSQYDFEQGVTEVTLNFPENPWTGSTAVIQLSKESSSSINRVSGPELEVLIDQESVRWKAQSSQAYTLSVYDIQGGLQQEASGVSEVGINRVLINSSLSSGIYIIHLKSGDYEGIFNHNKFP